MNAIPWPDVVARAAHNVMQPVQPLNATSQLVHALSEIVLSLEEELAKLRAAAAPKTEG